MKAVALPLVNKVIEGKLVLIAYNLNSSQIESFAKTLQDTGYPKVDSFYLDNCGIGDEELSILFDGLAN